MRGAVRFEFSRSLRHFWGGPESLDVRATTLSEALREADARIPGLAARVLDDTGAIRGYVHVFVNKEPVMSRPDGVALAPGDIVHVLPSVAGG